jgi:glycosyltransferase involved in cell wall biosynthesis
MLCVRGPLYPRRGSALAGVACGLPIVAYGGAAEGTPIAEAGVELVPHGDRQALGAAMQRILLDKDLWQSLHERSLQAHDRYFSWEFIAQKFDELLAPGAGDDKSAENSGA